MQIYPGSLSRRSKSANTGRKTRDAKNNFYHCATVLLVCAAVLGVFAAISYGYMSLERNIRMTQKNIDLTNSEISYTRRSIEQQQNRYAELTSQQHIMRKIAEFRLPLVLINPNQVAINNLQILSPLQASRVQFRIHRDTSVASNNSFNRSRTY